MNESMLEAVDGLNPRDWSQQPCPVCTFHHRLDDFRYDMRVRVLSSLSPSNAKFVGAVGVVCEWRQMASPIYVRVQFPTPDGDDSYDYRANFYPCQLEHA